MAPARGRKGKLRSKSSLFKVSLSFSILSVPYVKNKQKKGKKKTTSYFPTLKLEDTTTTKNKKERTKEKEKRVTKAVHKSTKSLKNVEANSFVTWSSIACTWVKANSFACTITRHPSTIMTKKIVNGLFSLAKDATIEIDDDTTLTGKKCSPSPLWYGCNTKPVLLINRRTRLSVLGIKRTCLVDKARQLSFSPVVTIPPCV